MLIRVIFINTHPNLLITRSGRWISISRFETILTHTQPLNYQIKENMPRNLHKSSTKSMFINSHIFIVIASVWLDFTKSFYLKSVTIRNAQGEGDPGSERSGVWFTRAPIDLTPITVRLRPTDWNHYLPYLAETYISIYEKWMCHKSINNCVVK